MSRLLFNPLFWAIAIILTWMVFVTMSIASNPEGARAQTLPASEVAAH
ncbi:hypothetical protein JOF56_001102 [Kibdelosporangium banguiense]|uniref:ABC transporter permease n=1 Tax=Kibdelosporangium banguiense TaxID=1365924 RepID=A0ABS4T8G4_9PSEU|nr:hypothetical protein [Kibdelosporangium banguiense]MBP2320717.1 hypothetical protein [Kibdelosporangium banguiense]